MSAALSVPRVADFPPPPASDPDDPAHPVESSATAAPGTRELLVTRAKDVRMRRVRWLWEGRIPLGAFTLLAGREGLGKSVVSVNIAAQVTRGTLPGELLGRPRSVIIVAAEDALDTTIVPRLVAAGADLGRVLFVRVRSEDGTEGLPVLPLDVGRVRELVATEDVALVILDPATSVIDGSLDGNKDRELRQALEPLSHMAGETGVAVLGLAHFGKTGGRDALQLILGSSAWAQVVRAALGVARDPSDDAGACVLSSIKANLGPRMSHLGYLIAGTTITTDDGPTEVAHLQWTGAVTRGVDELLASASHGDDRDEVKERDAFLRDTLLSNGGSLPVADLQRASRAAGYSPDQLKRSKKALGVTAHKSGYAGGWVWSLPEGVPQPQTAPQGGDEGGTHTDALPSLPSLPSKGAVPPEESVEESEGGGSSALHPSAHPSLTSRPVAHPQDTLDEESPTVDAAAGRSGGGSVDLSLPENRWAAAGYDR